jgi:predicted nucleotidyltransferase
MIGQDMLRQMVEQIADQFHPRRVILFGSQAVGIAADGSDVDFLVISDQAFPSAFSSRELALAIRKSLGRFPVACDVIVKTDADYHRLRGVVNHIVYLAARYGKVVYER